MPRTRAATRVLDLGLTGSWIQLEPVTPATAAEFAEIDARRWLNPAMGAQSGGSSPFAPPMLVREKKGGRAVGIVENFAQPGGTATFMAYIDPVRGRAGYGTEAISLYLSRVFDGGARRVIAEVLSFNTDMIGILRKVNFPPQARLREHVYVGGRFWDVIIYSFDRADWDRVIKRYRRKLPGGDRAPAALGPA